MRALAPLPVAGNAKQVRQLSRERYGRDLTHVETEMVDRRKAPERTTDRPAFGADLWDNIEQ